MTERGRKRCNCDTLDGLTTSLMEVDLSVGVKRPRWSRPGPCDAPFEGFMSPLALPPSATSVGRKRVAESDLCSAFTEGVRLQPRPKRPCRWSLADSFGRVSADGTVEVTARALRKASRASPAAVQWLRAASPLTALLAHLTPSAAASSRGLLLALHARVWVPPPEAHGADSSHRMVGLTLTPAAVLELVSGVHPPADAHPPEPERDKPLKPAVIELRSGVCSSCRRFVATLAEDGPRDTCLECIANAAAAEELRRALQQRCSPRGAMQTPPPPQTCGHGAAPCILPAYTVYPFRNRNPGTLPGSKGSRPQPPAYV